MRQLITEAIQDGKMGLGSSKRLNSVMATLAMSIAIVILAIAGMNGHDVALAISGVAVALSGLCGANYVGGLKHETVGGNEQRGTDAEVAAIRGGNAS